MKLRLLFIIIFPIFTLVFLSSCRTTKTVIPVLTFEQLIRKELDSSQVLKSAFSGLVMYDISENKTIFHQNEDKYFVPASNVKILTLYSCLKVLGDSIPSLRYIENDSTLIFWGLGDPTILNPEFPESPVINFLRARSNKRLIYSDANFDMPHFGKGWMWDDYRYPFQTEISPLPVYGNLVELFLDTDTVIVFPEVFAPGLSIKDTLRSAFGRNVHQNTFVVPTSRLSGASRTYHIPFITGAALTTTLLSDALESVVHYNPVPLSSDARLLMGTSMDTVLKVMMNESDNFRAEQLLIGLTSDISDTLRSEIGIKYMLENHFQYIDPPLKWVDGSGLSRYNLMTPSAFLILLKELYETMPFENLQKYFNYKSIRNPIDSRKKIEQFIYAKSGSMSGVFNLSGYLYTKSGKPILFSFMNNNFNEPVLKVREEVERILKEVHEKY
ncbi:MAG: D-alanyl-D-alanine carboxypeptidase [Saprospiraceae bacterium]|nr:D-alanyl-D-alanine carboxypeptidase [Saprospiraceae bacterium]